jgi:hypothetical protein
MLVILACLAGVLLGLIFNVFVLFPVTVAGILAYALMSQDQGLGPATASILFPAISLQAGYMIGLTGRDTLAPLLARLNLAHSKRV